MRDAGVAAVSALGRGGTCGRVGSSVQLAARAARTKAPTVCERHIEPPGLIPGRAEGARARGEPCVRCCKKLVTTHDRRPRDDVLPAVRALGRGHCVTWTGVELEAIAPFPSCPAKLSPQQYTRPLDVAPQLVSPCASTPLKLSPLAT